MNILEKIKELRNAKSISQYDMADKLGISQSTYFQIEKGKTELTVNRLYEIAGILEIDVAELLGIKPTLPQGNTDYLKRIEELEQWIKDKEFIIKNLKLSILNLQIIVRQFFEHLEWHVAEHLKIGHIEIDGKIEPYDFEKGFDYYKKKYKLFDLNSEFDFDFIFTDEDRIKIIEFVKSNDLLAPLVGDFIQYKKDMGINDLWTKSTKSIKVHGKEYNPKIHDKDFLHEDTSIEAWLELRASLGKSNYEG